MIKITLTRIGFAEFDQPEYTHIARTEDIEVAVDRAVKKHFGRTKRFIRDNNRTPAGYLQEAIRGSVYGQICYPIYSGSQLLWNPLGQFSVSAELI